MALLVSFYHSILNSYDIVDSETAAIVSMPGKIEDVLSWAIFVEQPEGYYRVRLRSKGPIINTIAKTSWRRPSGKWR